MSVDVAGLDLGMPSRWVRFSLAAGLVLSTGWSVAGGTGVDVRVARDGLFFFAAPALVALAWGKEFRDLGWTINRRAVRNTLVLSAFVLPFYLVGSSLPSIRSYYPMWETAPTLASFLPHAAKQLAIVLAAETFYRGMLCVGVREIGFKSVFISPVLYAIHHTAKPPIELLLSGPTDVLFGAVDYDCRSILPSVVAHGFGITLLDWLVLHDPMLPPEQLVRWLRWLPVVS